MAKQLSLKTRVIREAISANPDKGPKAVAALVNKAEERERDGIHVTPTEVAHQQLALQKEGAVRPPPAPPAPEAPVRRAAPEPEPEPEPVKPAPKKRVREPILREAPARPALSAVELIDRVFALADDCGGMAQLKRLVDRLARV
jgi:hypothetical protein